MRRTSKTAGHQRGLLALLALLVAVLGVGSAQALVLINEVDADQVSTDSAEFIELYGGASESLDGLVLVLFNGSDDASYLAFDLDGYACDADGFFVICGNAATTPNCDLDVSPDTNLIQNGADAVALYIGNDTDFPNDTPVTATNLVDAIVYDTSDADDAGLIDVLTPGQPQINEGENGSQTTHSNQRIPDGGGGALVTTSYVAQDPTPGVTNGGVLPQPPQVTNVYHRPLLPEPGETTTVYADGTDSDGNIASMTIHYQINGGGFTNTVAMTLDAGDTYTGTLPSGANGTVIDYYVEAVDDDLPPLSATNPSDAPVSFYSFTIAPELITPIAFVHADSIGYDGTVIQIQAQVYIPGDYKADGTTVSAYVQDASGRGMNIFGTNYSTGMALLNDTSNIVKITGRVDWYFSTVELVNYEVELVSSGNPVLTPDVQTTVAAASPNNEGTYIETTGDITAMATTGGSNPAHNWTINDGTGDVVIRIDDDIVDMSGWLIGDELVAAGAGGSYSGQGQIIVGLLSDITNNGQAPDLTPPLLLSATLTSATVVTLQFDEPIDATTGDDPLNYEVYETATPANTIGVLTATVQPDPSYVLLTLDASPAGTPHTVRINNVEDQHGNPIAANTTDDIVEPTVADIQISEIMQNPFHTYDSGGEWFEVTNLGGTPIDMNGWTIKDADFDSHVIANGGPLTINPGEYKVFCVNADTMATEGVPVFYEYSGITLSNSDDELILLDTALLEVDNVPWDNGLTFPDPNGLSMQWNETGDNFMGMNWGIGGPIFGTGNDRGTPGAANDITTAVGDTPLRATALGRNYPNPFNPKTSFSFSLERADHVRLGVFDIRGRLVRNIVDAELGAGEYVDVFSWDGRDQSGRPVNSGTYFYRLTTGSGFSQAEKMTLLK